MDYVELIGNFHVLVQILIYKLSLKIKFRYADLFFVCEQVPNAGNYVCLSDDIDEWGYKKARINWQYSEQEHSKLISWFSHIIPSFSLLLFNLTSEPTSKIGFTSAAHHLGTCRMGDSSVNSVIDGNLKVHGVDNLFVCDGSVFPSGGNVNPGLTIAAIAVRLSDYLKKL